MDPSPHQALLCHWPKFHSSALPDPDYLPNSEHPLIFALIVCVVVLEFLLSLGKSDGLVWHSRLSGFPAWYVVGRHLHNSLLLRGSLHGQNLQLVLIILGESASAMKSTDRTTPPKVDKADTSLVEAPTAQALVVQLGSKTPDDAPIDDHPYPLNFAVAVSWIVGWMNFLPQKYWPDPGKPDGPVRKIEWSSFCNP
jgi:hypothetical protein